MQTWILNVLGVAGNILSVALFIPGAVGVWRNRGDAEALRSASLWQQWFIVANALIWGLYAVLTGAYWSGVPGIVNLPLALFTAHLIRRARRGRSRVDTVPDVVAVSAARPAHAE